MISVKTAHELEQMRVACRISALALKAAGEAIEAGITTADIDKIVYDTIIRHGAKPNFKGLYGFPGSACISVNDQVIHGIPSKKVVIRPGDIVSVDTGAVIGGFHGDNAATFACGKVDSEAQRLMDVTRESLYKGIAAAVVGSRVGDISAAVQAWVEQNGFSVVRSFVGHGVGKKLQLQLARKVHDGRIILENFADAFVDEAVVGVLLHFDEIRNGEHVFDLGKIHALGGSVHDLVNFLLGHVSLLEITDFVPRKKIFQKNRLSRKAVVFFVALRYTYTVRYNPLPPKYGISRAGISIIAHFPIVSAICKSVKCPNRGNRKKNTKFFRPFRAALRPSESPAKDGK